MHTSAPSAVHNAEQVPVGVSSGARSSNEVPQVSPIVSPIISPIISQIVPPIISETVQEKRNLSDLVVAFTSGKPWQYGWYSAYTALWQGAALRHRMRSRRPMCLLEPALWTSVYRVRQLLDQEVILIRIRVIICWC